MWASRSIATIYDRLILCQADKSLEHCIVTIYKALYCGILKYLLDTKVVKDSKSTHSPKKSFGTCYNDTVLNISRIWSAKSFGF